MPIDVDKIKSELNGVVNTTSAEDLRSGEKSAVARGNKGDANEKDNSEELKNGFHKDAQEPTESIESMANGQTRSELSDTGKFVPVKNTSSLFSPGALTIRVSDSVENLTPEKKPSPVEPKPPVVVESDSTSGRSSSLSSYSTQPESSNTVGETQKRQISPIVTKIHYSSDYPRIPVKNFEEEYYRKHRAVDDGLEELDYRPSTQLVTPEVIHSTTKPQSIYRSSGVLLRSDLPPRSEPTHNRYASLPAMASSHSDKKIAGGVASVRVRPYPMEDRLNEEYSKLQRLFGAWQMQLKRNEAMLSYGAEIPDGLLKEFNQLQTDMIAQHQLVQKLCDEALKTEKKSDRSDTIWTDLRRTSEVINGSKEPERRPSEDSDSFTIVDRSNVVRPSQIFGPRVKLGGDAYQQPQFDDWSSRKSWQTESSQSPFIPNRRDVVSQSMSDMPRVTRNQFGTDRPNYTAKSRAALSPGTYDNSPLSPADYRQGLKPVGLRRTSFNESTSPPKTNFYANSYSSGLRRTDQPTPANNWKQTGINGHQHSDRSVGNEMAYNSPVEHKTANRVHFDESTLKEKGSAVIPPPPPPPLLIAQMQQVSLKPASQRQLKKANNSDPRSDLMSAIRSFGGSKGFGKGQN